MPDSQNTEQSSEEVTFKSLSAAIEKLQSQIKALETAFADASKQILSLSEELKSVKAENEKFQTNMTSKFDEEQKGITKKVAETVAGLGISTEPKQIAKETDKTLSFTDELKAKATK